MTSHFLSWRQLASLKVGGAICLPVILAGHSLCQTFGLVSALVAIAIGNALLLILALGMCRMSVETRLATTDNAKNYFGPLGTHFFAAALLFAKCCWIAIQLDLMAIACQDLLPVSVDSTLVHLFFGLAVVLISMQGIHALSRLTSWSLPILIGTMGFALYINREIHGQLSEMAFSPEGISVAMATGMTAVIDMPTYFRHARSQADSVIATVVFIALAVPLIEGIGIYLAYHHPGATVMHTLQTVQNPVWNIWVTVFLILAGWSTNNSNLYSATACLGTLCPKLGHGQRTLILGTVATLASLFGMLHHFTLVLQVAAVAIGSMGAVIFVRYTLAGLSLPAHHTINLLVWAIGTIVGFLSIFKVVSITSIPLIDACTTAAFMTVASHILVKHPKEII